MHAAHKIHEAVAQVADQAQQVKNVLCAGVELAVHGQAQDEQRNDRDGQQCAAAPFAQQKMTRPRNQPSGNEGKIDETLVCVYLPRSAALLSADPMPF